MTTNASAARRWIGAKRSAWLAAGLALAAFAPAPGRAQTADPGLGLVGLAYANDIEQAAAQANQQVFDALDASCNPGGIFDTVPEPGAPPAAASSCAFASNRSRRGSTL